MLGASFDCVEDNKAFADKFCFPFKLLCDPQKTLAPYGAVDDKGSGFARRISYLIGPDRKIVRVWPKVKPSEHPAEVLAAVP